METLKESPVRFTRITPSPAPGRSIVTHNEGDGLDFVRPYKPAKDVHVLVSGEKSERANAKFIEIPLSDGRKRTATITGEGFPVIVEPGIPGSSGNFLFDPPPDSGIQVIVVNRPGHNGSTPRNDVRPQVALEAYDIKEMTAYLGINTFGAVGFSGGTPYALSLSQLGFRVPRIILIASLVPPEFSHTWSQDMPALNTEVYNPANNVEGIADKYSKLYWRINKVTRDPGWLIPNELDPDLTTRSREILSDPRIRAGIENGYAQAGQEGYIDDVNAVSSKWGFDPFSINSNFTRVDFVHGTEDEFSPFQEASLFAAAIPGANLNIIKGGGHFDGYVEYPDFLVRYFDDFARRYAKDRSKPGYKSRFVF